MNMNILIYGMIYLGSAVMMYSIVRYFRFEREMNLHPHAVLIRVLWRWYQSPFGS